MTKRSSFLSSLLLSSTLLAALPNNAAPIFSPANEPQVYIAPIALSDNDLQNGDVNGYRPWFENGAWQGDIIELDVSSNGTVSSTIDLTESPPRQSDPNLDAAEQNWSARIQFAEQENADQNNPARINNPLDPNDDMQYWDIFRYVVTGIEENNTLSATPFRLENLPPELQRSILDSAQIGQNNITERSEPLNPNDPLTLEETTAVSTIVDFIRGDRSNEVGPNTTDFPNREDNPFRRRLSILGDIIHSPPKYVAEPDANINLPGYQTFAETNANRPPRVYVGANDGMLHAFDAETGDETFAYIPSTVIENLGLLTNIPYIHTYFVDGQIAIADADLSVTDEDATDASDTNWRTVLVSGLGAGGKGFFALDITRSNFLNEDDLANNILLWEIDSDGVDKDDASDDNNDIGYSYSRPTIARLNNDRWYAIVGNGYNSADNRAALLLINLASGEIEHTLSAPGAQGTEESPNGLSSPSLIDIDNDGNADIAYAGDINGNLWKFELDIADENDDIGFDVSFSGTPLLSLTENRPIIAAPDVAEGPLPNSFYVYVGTGRAFTPDDLLSNDTDQVIFGVIDNGSNVGLPISADEIILDQEFAEETQTLTDIPDKDIRTSTFNPLNLSVAPTHRAWRVILNSTQQGERFLTEPQTRAGRVQISSFRPPSGTDNQAENWFTQPAFGNGGAPLMPIFDINEDGILSNADNFNESGAQDDIAMGLNIGAGIRSRATIAVISETEDTALINGLLVPDLSACPERFADICLGAFTDPAELDTRFEELLDEIRENLETPDLGRDDIRNALRDEIRQRTDDRDSAREAFNDADPNNNAQERDTLRNAERDLNRLRDLRDQRQDAIDFRDGLTDDESGRSLKSVIADINAQGVQSVRNLGPNFGLGQRSWVELEP